MSEVTFVTPTFKGDYERFCLQRESIERCGITIPHVAIVEDQDIHLFRNMPFQQNLTILSTRDVLPPQLERRRMAGHTRRRNPCRWFMGKPLHGWFTQQIVKLASSRVVNTPGVICLDSDVLFVDKVSNADFFAPDDRLHLYETDDDLDVEMGEWLVSSMKFLGVPLRHQPLHNFIHQLVPLHRQVLLDLHEYIKERYKKDWALAMTEHNVFEYMTYGVFARYIDKYKHQCPVRPSLCVYYWWPEQIGEIEDSFLARIIAQEAKAVLVSSNLSRPVAEYRSLVEQAWAQRRTA